MIWDWNGTLFHDFEGVVSALNQSLADELTNKITPEIYRASFRVPMKKFTEFLINRELSEREFTHINSRFHAAYNEQIDNYELAPTAREALQVAKEAGYVQIIVSMWQQDRLRRLVDTQDITRYFSYISGDQSDGRGDKVERVASCLTALDAGASSSTMIGDVTGDAHVARLVGCHCILVSGNSSQTEAKLAAEAPVAATVLEAIELVGTWINERSQ